MLADGSIPAPDFLKVDVESYEEKVFLGARSLNRHTIGIEFETNFNFSINFPETHFVGCYRSLCEDGFALFDMTFDRHPNRKPSTYDVLLSRDYVKEVREATNYRKVPPPPAPEKFIKCAIMFELYGLNRCAIDILKEFAPPIDIDKAIHLLSAVPSDESNMHAQR